MINPFVVSVSAVSGGGKTTIVDLLKQNLSPCSVLYFDDYDFSGTPDNLVEWAAQGADFNLWDLEPLKRDILTIRKQSRMQYLLLDYPFGYENSLIRPWIDFAVFLDTPLDIALCRRIQRDYTGGPAGELLSDLRFYAEKGREAYLPMLYQVKPGVDLIVDDTLPPDTIAGVIIRAIQNKKPQV